MFEAGVMMPPEVLLLPRTVLAILGFLLFHMKVSAIHLRSLKNFAGILLGIALNLFFVCFVFVFRDRFSL